MPQAAAVEPAGGPSRWAHVLEDSILDVSDARPRDRPHGLESDVGAPEVVEEPGTASEEERHEVDLDFVSEHVVVRAGLAGTFAVHLTKGLQVEHPIVDMVTPFAERVVNALVGSRNVAVEGHHDVEPELAHSESSLTRALGPVR